MTKIKYDVSDVDSGQDFDTPIPIGLYLCRIEEIGDTPSQNTGEPMLTVVLTVAKGDWKGRKLWDYIVLNDNSKWKLRQFLEAVGHINKNGKGTAGELDPQDYVGDLVQVKVRHEPDDRPETKDANGGKPVMRARPQNLLPVAEDADPEELAEDEPDEPAADDDSDVTYQDIAELTRDELEEYIEEEELDVSYNKRTADDVLLTRVAEELGVEEEPQAYSDMSLGDLKATCKERGLPSSGTKPKLVARLEADDESGDGDDGEPF